MSRLRISLLALGAADRRAHRAGHDGQRRIPHEVRRQRQSRRWSASGPAPSRRTSRPCSTASRRSSRASRSSTPRPATTRRRCSPPRSPAATRPTSRRSASPASSSSSPARKAIKPIDFVKPHDGEELRAVVGHARHVSAASSTAWSSRAPTSRPSGTRRRGVQERRRQAAQDLDAAARRGQDAARLGHARVLDRRRRRLDAHRPVREHLPPAGRRRPSTTSWPTHKIKWTDPSVKTALKTMAQIFGDTGNIYGGTSGALQTDFPTSVNNVFSTPPKAAMVIEGDFVPGAVDRQGQAGHGLQRVPVPVDRRLGAGRRRRRRHRRDVQGHARRRARSSRTSRRPRRPRSGPSAAASPRPTRTCRRAPTRTRSRARPRRRSPRRRRSASTCPTSRRRPSAARPGQGEWKILQDFLKNPKDVDGTASKLETAAAAAYKK